MARSRGRPRRRSVAREVGARKITAVTDSVERGRVGSSRVDGREPRAFGPRMLHRSIEREHDVEVIRRAAADGWRLPTGEAIPRVRSSAANCG